MSTPCIEQLTFGKRNDVLKNSSKFVPAYAVEINLKCSKVLFLIVNSTNEGFIFFGLGLKI